MSIVHPNEQELDQLVQENAVVFVDFWATWCGPCKMIAPIIEKLAQKYEGKAIVAKVDIDEQQALAQRYQIMSIPTVLLFKNGKLTQTEVGAHSEAAYAKMIDAAL